MREKSSERRSKRMTHLRHKSETLILSSSGTTFVSFDLLCDNLNGDPKHTRAEEGWLASH